MTTTTAPRSGETTPTRVPPDALRETFDDTNHISNIESFVVSTVPLVPVLEEEGGRPEGAGDEQDASASGGDSSSSSPAFALKDLWSFFDEWSAYGVEVPLALDDEEHQVCQYYVPFLSGIQIFKATEVDENETNAEASVTAATEKTKSDAPALEAKKTQHTPLPSGIDAATRGGETIPGRTLVFQYFEQASPYSRPPLSDTTARLVAENPVLNDLRSDEMHQASWVAVAWYPIYRIPVGQTLRDLSACFLTYHCLSTRTEDRAGDGAGDGIGQTTETEKTDDTEKITEKPDPPRHLRGCPAPPVGSVSGEAVLSGRSNKLRNSDPTQRQLIPLRTFGLAYYKLRAELWRPAEIANWLKTMRNGARGWLEQQKVIHPDFEFFSHRG